MSQESKTEDFLFFVFKGVSRANTVNMNAPLLILLFVIYILLEVADER
jgi:hypothetical protein